MGIARRGHRGPILAACCVRRLHDLAYLQVHERLMQLHPQYQYVPLATREPGQVGKRYLQDLVTSGELEQRLGQSLNPAHTHIYLCGNPLMIGVPLFDKVDQDEVVPDTSRDGTTAGRAGFHCRFEGNESEGASSF